MKKDKHAVLSILRDKILSGALKQGDRLAEIPTAEMLGVSRTPVRIAFRALEQEGLLTQLPRRGYQVRQITGDEIAGSVEVRGVLEGLAVRQIVEKGLADSLIEPLKQCLTAGDALFVERTFNEEKIQAYVEINRQFHDCLVKGSQNNAIAMALQINEHLPMASVNALVFNPEQTDREYERLYYAHQQHHAIVQALIAGQGARAEALMKEHAQAALNSYEQLSTSGPSKTIRSE
ncbi:GntR family transcriptional regulator [Alteromonas lipolytica]|uniref:GntR family transcriptional regulator n=1 Tax=Alteromonas lipolytica TaxID=1856405 RepID=A0A1E8FEH4_9ALTE|nr:GntR family transcriptional regulator [Alteromonas lipolytica]OFI34320.1 GntR family transcriptional regulator [Alteromonas lipolytica]GGF82493.1 GntR family transcriptional regulator [Alteromonas lipolytica]